MSACCGSRTCRRGVSFISDSHSTDCFAVRIPPAGLNPYRHARFFRVFANRSSHHQSDGQRGIHAFLAGCVQLSRDVIAAIRLVRMNFHKVHQIAGLIIFASCPLPDTERDNCRKSSAIHRRKRARA